jgi:hypothetical protein
MRLAKFIKRPGERKRYAIVYTEWLDTGETVAGVTFGVTPTNLGGLIVDASSISESGTEVIFFVNFGDEGTTYTVDVQITTSGGQIKQDQILFTIRDH